MKTLYLTPDRTELRFSFKEESLPHIFTDSFRANHWNSNYIRQIARNVCGAQETFRNGVVWYKVSNLLFRYRPKNLSFLFETNPIRTAAVNLEKNGYYYKQIGLDLNSNFIDTAYLQGDANDNIEHWIYLALEQDKNTALQIISEFLSKGFGIDTTLLRAECHFKLVEFACDSHSQNPDSAINDLEKPLVANFGDTTKYGTAKSHSITVFKRKRNSGTHEHGKETRILYQKSPSIIRYERVFDSKEMGLQDIIAFDWQMLQTYFVPFKEKVQSELEELRKQAALSNSESDSESDRIALVFWLWKRLSQVRIPPDKFYLFEKAVETGQLDTKLLGITHLKKRLLKSGAFVPALESADNKNQRYFRLNLENFRNCLGS